MFRSKTKPFTFRESQFNNIRGNQLVGNWLAYAENPNSAGARPGAETWGLPARAWTSASPRPPPPRSQPGPALPAAPPAGMWYKPNLTAHMPAAALNARGVHSTSTSVAISSQYRQLLSDRGPLSLGHAQETGNSQVPQSKYAELLAIIEELGKEIRPTYAGSKSAMERLKRGIIHA